METRGFEPPTIGFKARRSPCWATSPLIYIWINQFLSSWKTVIYFSQRPIFISILNYTTVFKLCQEGIFIFFFKNLVLPRGFEPLLLAWKTSVLTVRRWEHNLNHLHYQLSLIRRNFYFYSGGGDGIRTRNPWV